MIEIELDGKKVDIVEGSMIMHAAEKAGTYIPHFCYHKKLSIAAMRGWSLARNSGALMPRRSSNSSTAWMSISASASASGLRLT